MATVYQYNANGYYVGETEDYGENLPCNCTSMAPSLKDGFIPYWTGVKWSRVENHIGERGYLNGEPHTIMEYGHLPDGWSKMPPPPTSEGQQNAIIVTIEAHLDAFARTRGYDDIKSAADYKGDPNPKFDAEGQYAFIMRSATWTKACEILGSVLSGARPMPTIEEVITELPPLAWPLGLN